MATKTIAVLFGGQSSEHEVSCLSGMNVIKNLDKEIYDVLMIGITKEGRWLRVNSIDDIKSGKWVDGRMSAVLSPDAGHRGFLMIEGNHVEIISIDVVFPVLHGFYGEDGTVQGLLELSGIPYVGCGVLASSVSMDKLFTKLVIDPLNIRQANYVPVVKEDFIHIGKTLQYIEDAIPYPVFVKPSNAGSSRGVSKAGNREELIKGLQEAIKHDKKILVEEAIIGREIECAVFGKNDIVVSVPGEVLAGAEFYDYDAKYNNDDSKTVVDPELPEGVKEQIQELSQRIFKAVDGFGLARVDFFVENGTNEVVFNEINTMPGFTEISMYSMLMEEVGYPYKDLLNNLIELAFKR